jgi:hypothetical protein
MKTTTKFLQVVFLLTILVSHVAALNVTLVDRGTSFITWDWDNPSNVTDMYLDGALMCGYESTVPSISIVDLRSGSCHNLTLITDVGNGSDTSCALWGNSTRGGGETQGNVGGAMSNDSVMYGLIGGAVGAVVIMGFFIRRR